jgi:four helix bundle protein
MEKPHKKLDVWQAAMQLATEVYELTAIFPVEERYGLVAQMRRAAVSIPSNIAEGAARHGAAEFRNFLNIAQGSLSELDTQLELVRALGFVRQVDLSSLNDLMTRVDKMLTMLIRKLSRDSIRKT